MTRQLRYDSAMPKPRTLEPEQWELWNIWMQAQRLLARELDRRLQHDYGISKTEFSVLVTLHQAPGGRMRANSSTAPRTRPAAAGPGSD
jgi:hypothetical protein